MKLIFWGVVVLFVFMIIAFKCGPSATGPTTNTTTAAPPAVEKIPEPSPSPATYFSTPLPPEPSRPVTYAPPQNPRQVLPGHVFPAVQPTEPPVPFSHPQVSPSPTVNSISAAQALHMEGPPPLLRRRR